jgi:hypothetical protein
MQLVLKGLWSRISSTKIATSQSNVVIGSILRRGQISGDVVLFTKQWYCLYSLSYFTDVLPSGHVRSNQTRLRIHDAICL